MISAQLFIDSIMISVVTVLGNESSIDNNNYGSSLGRFLMNHLVMVHCIVCFELMKEYRLKTVYNTHVTFGGLALGLARTLNKEGRKLN